MATGARMRDIFVQFNTESAVVCTVGGLIGIALICRRLRLAPVRRQRRVFRRTVLDGVRLRLYDGIGVRLLARAPGCAP